MLRFEKIFAYAERPRSAGTDGYGVRGLLVDCARISLKMTLASALSGASDSYSCPSVL